MKAANDVPFIYSVATGDIARELARLDDKLTDLFQMMNDLLTSLVTKLNTGCNLLRGGCDPKNT